MKKAIVSVGWISLILFSCKGPQKMVVAPADVRPAQKISIPGINGRIDHLSLSGDGQKLYLAALGSNAVVVLDLVKSRIDTVLSGMHEPQGVVLSPQTKRLLVTNGGDGHCNFFFCYNLKESPSIDIGDDADNIRYDSTTRMAYVGYGGGGIAVIDMNYARQDGLITLTAHPEAFELDPAKKRIYVNVPEAGKIEVVDLDKKTVIDSWAVPSRGNFPMASDPENHRIFIATRYPARLYGYDTENGKTTLDLPCDGDADDIFYDPATRHIYISCGDGFLDDYSGLPANGGFVPSRRIITRKGARTGLYVPATKTFYLAVPKMKEDEIAEVWVYHF